MLSIRRDNRVKKPRELLIVNKSKTLNVDNMFTIQKSKNVNWIVITNLRLNKEIPEKVIKESYIDGTIHNEYIYKNKIYKYMDYDKKYKMLNRKSKLKYNFLSNVENKDINDINDRIYSICVLSESDKLDKITSKTLETRIEFLIEKLDLSKEISNSVFTLDEIVNSNKPNISKKDFLVIKNIIKKSFKKKEKSEIKEIEVAE